jgi:hypothetical protein
MSMAFFTGTLVDGETCEMRMERRSRWDIGINFVREENCKREEALAISALAMRKVEENEVLNWREKDYFS